MVFVVLALVIAGVLLSALTLICVIQVGRQVARLEERVAWLEGSGPIEEGSEPDSEVPEIMKAGSTQPPGSA
jgi:hypothetical protein